jgi:hypothetical protein
VAKLAEVGEQEGIGLGKEIPDCSVVSDDCGVLCRLDHREDPVDVGGILPELCSPMFEHKCVGCKRWLPDGVPIPLGLDLPGWDCAVAAELPLSDLSRLPVLDDVRVEI